MEVERMYTFMVPKAAVKAPITYTLWFYIGCTGIIQS